MIKGIDVILYTRVQAGMDPFNRPQYEEQAVTVKNVLVSPSTETEVIDSLNLTGAKAVYTLAIPKGDANDWQDKIVEFFGQKWHTVGCPIEGIPELIPLEWNKKVRVERYV